MATKKRRLTDLYQKGRLLTIDDGEGPVEAWIQKLNPVESETALRKSNAARSRVLAEGKDKDSDAYQTAMAELLDMSLEDKIEYLVEAEIAKKRPVLEAELAEQDEWSKDDYLQGLTDAWTDGLQDKYNSDARDSESVKVFEELERFSAEITDKEEKERKHLTEEFKLKSEDKITDLVAEGLLRTQADLKWMLEYRKCQIWLGTKEPDNHSAPYFSSRDEIDSLTQEILLALIEEYNKLEIDVLEGKDSEGTSGSSSQSDTPKIQATEDSSGQQELVA